MSSCMASQVGRKSSQPWEYLNCVCLCLLFFQLQSTLPTRVRLKTRCIFRLKSQSIRAFSSPPPTLWHIQWSRTTPERCFLPLLLFYSFFFQIIFRGLSQYEVKLLSFGVASLNNGNTRTGWKKGNTLTSCINAIQLFSHDLLALNWFCWPAPNEHKNDANLHQLSFRIIKIGHHLVGH